MAKEVSNMIKKFLPTIEDKGFIIDNCEFDSATPETGRKRGDIWLKDSKGKYLGLIEVKDITSVIGDNDWRDAMRQGKEKSLSQGLHYYIVTNSNDYTRYYNSHTEDEILFDEKPITSLLSIDNTLKVLSQVNEKNSIVYSVLHSGEIYEKDFLNCLEKIENVYRCCSIANDSCIEPTISFIIIKYISEMEDETRTLDSSIKLWKDFELVHIKTEIDSFISNVWGNDSEYGNNKYKDFKDLISFPSTLTNNSYKLIYNEIDKLNFHGNAKFDIFGSVYEKFADDKTKKAFGQYYTRRHITGFVARAIFNKSVKLNIDTIICDPACGSGGFLTEAFKTIKNLDCAKDINFLELIRKKFFYGFDNDKKSIARTKLNMFLAGDGHNNIFYIKDSLDGWNKSKQWNINNIDYILANPPMGKYSGTANLEEFTYTSQKAMEQLFVEKMVKALKPGGRMAIIINDGPLENPTLSRFRSKLISDLNIIAVISLPKYSFAPYTQEKTYVFIADKKISKTDKNENIFMSMVDYDGFSNNGKRFKTKYHDDLPELEDRLISFLNTYKMKTYDELSSLYNKKVNNEERNAGLFGYKCKIIKLEEIIKNDNVLLTEKYLRSSTMKESLTIREAVNEIQQLINEIRGIVINEN